MSEFIYYNSPIGVLRISHVDDCISEITFVETAGETGTAAGSGITPDDPQVIKECIAQLDNYFAGKNLIFNLPLKQPGTAFQQTVWAELQKIREGQTISYMQLSKKLRNIKAIRAIGTANGKNNIAIVIPCHRVIGSDGSLVGYAGELWRKKWLLQHEAKYTNGVQSLF